MAKTPSLASKVETNLVKPLQLPAVFGQPSIPIQARAWAPQVTFAHPKRADEWKRISARYAQAGGAHEGEMYYVHNDDIRYLPTAKLGWIAGRQFWCSTTQAGQLTAVSFKEMPEPFRERVISAVLVYLDDGIMPAFMEWRTVKCGAAKALSDALAECQTPAWATKSVAHEHSLIVQQPMLRFYGVVALGDPRSGKTSGLPYRPAVCEVHPTSTTEWELMKSCETQEWSEKLQQIAARYASKLTELEGKQIRS